MSRLARETLYSRMAIEVGTMPMELVLVRHGETDYNRDGIFRGRMDVRLNATGIAMADATAEALKERVFDAIYSGPLKRSLVTARRIAAPHQIDVRVSPDFDDISYGLWQGKTETQVKERWPRLYAKWLRSPGRVKYPAGESTKTCWKRAVSGLRVLASNHSTGTVVVVSHRIPLKLMTAYMVGKRRGDIGAIRHDPCAMSIFMVAGREYTPVVLNDSSHLGKLARADQKDF